jgi:hypothetical protein
MVQSAQARGLRIFRRLREIPGCGDAAEPTHEGPRL